MATLLFLLLTVNRCHHFPGVSIVDFDQVIAGYEISNVNLTKFYC